jgi:predicted MPP superfamily phosphohydrolase
VKPTRREFLLGCVAVGAAATPVGWYGGVEEPGDIEIVRRSITIRQLPTRLDGLTVVQLSDLHVGDVSDVQRRMLEQVAALKPDLVLVTGDLADVKEAANDAADLVTGYQPPYGTWVVPGNRDHMAEAVHPLRVALAARNAQLLTNQAVRIDDKLWVVGADDPSQGLDDVAGAARDTPIGAVRILLAHSPNIVERLEGTRFDLVLVGHTHGGQINLPLVRDQWLRDGAARRYPAGLYDLGDSQLYVNRGIGTYYVPFRIGSRPEITFFTLHGA